MWFYCDMSGGDERGLASARGSPGKTGVEAARTSTDRMGFGPLNEEET
ncbi:hypothetical protein RCAP_rcc01677 [Rhodobacter capsulatus SB 1003]|uniref:Uncharacterized protein n=1 Tax=Rhodobacter capsulatus (strain ATCC BAA-309 / NBRC 16581 / SB1003) TaxID=272942 RepID=D5ATY3_RHOCB|nr:hypothetical protein RCAP_rcc01677 [Rhodobacter capsulatus SB 1003]